MATPKRPTRGNFGGKKPTRAAAGVPAKQTTPKTQPTRPNPASAGVKATPARSNLNTSSSSRAGMLGGSGTAPVKPRLSNMDSRSGRGR